MNQYFLFSFSVFQEGRFAVEQRLGDKRGVFNVVYKNSQLVRDAIFWQIYYRGQLW